MISSKLVHALKELARETPVIVIVNHILPQSQERISDNDYWELFKDIKYPSSQTFVLKSLKPRTPKAGNNFKVDFKANVTILED